MKKAIEIRTIGDDTYHYTAGYFPENKWIDNDTLVIARSVDESIGTMRDKPVEVELVKLSLKDNSIEILCKDTVLGYHYFVYGSKVYYSNRKNLKVIDINTREEKILYSCDGDIYCLSITNDGSTVAFCIGMANEPETHMIIDANTGAVRDSFVCEFPKPFIHALHTMICPTNPDLLYFCHEGVTEYIPNRMWLHDVKTGRNWNFAKQRLDENGNLGDCFGHEMWAPDGKGMYFVKYHISPVLPTGICYADVESGEVKFLYSGYKYWHVGVSQDGKYLMADTQLGVYDGNGESEVVVVDLEDNTENVIDIPISSGKHPCHPHPQLSPDNSKLIYTALDEMGRTVMKIAFLE